MCVSCPYLLERFTVTIIRASIQLFSYQYRNGLPSAPLIGSQGGTYSSSGSAFRGYHSVNETGAGGGSGGAVVGAGFDLGMSEDMRNNCLSFDTLWLSLRLLRGIPNEALAVLSERLGSGLICFVRILLKRPQAVGLEHWYLVFSLLSAATCGDLGRPYVFGAITELIESNNINDMNFTPCRHLVLRFLHRVFPGDVDEEVQCSNL
jgi:hypothetical protein